MEIPKSPDVHHVTIVLSGVRGAHKQFFGDAICKPQNSIKGYDAHIRAEPPRITTMIRAFSTSAVSAFKKDSVQQFKRLSEAAAVPKKWQPTPGNSFRSFAEYRLKVVNQSPLKLKALKTK